MRYAINSKNGFCPLTLDSTASFADKATSCGKLRENIGSKTVGESWMGQKETHVNYGGRFSVYAEKATMHFVCIAHIARNFR